MKIRLIKMAVLAIVAVLTVASTPQALAYETNNDVDAKEWKRTYKVADLLVVRPVGLAMALAGGAIFVATLPVTIISGDTEQAAETLVAQPARIAFNRR